MYINLYFRIGLFGIVSKIGIGMFALCLVKRSIVGKDCGVGTPHIDIPHCSTAAQCTYCHWLSSPMWFTQLHSFQYYNGTYSPRPYYLITRAAGKSTKLNKSMFYLDFIGSCPFPTFIVCSYCWNMLWMDKISPCRYRYGRYIHWFSTLLSTIDL